MSDERPAAGVELARRPRPTAPADLKVGEALGQYGASSSLYVQGLLNGASALLPGQTVTRSWELIRRMRRHYQIDACLLVQQLAETGAQWSIECDDDDVREWLTSAYELVADDVQRTSARALWAGYSPNTLVWNVDPELGLVATEVRDLEPSRCEPLVDGDGNYVGLVQDRHTTGLEVDALQTLWIVERMESGNLYGRSVLEAAYDPWADHAQLRAFHGRYLERFGEPIVKGRAPAGQSVSNSAAIAQAAALVSAGLADPSSIPAPTLVDNVVELQIILEELRNHSVLAFPSTPDIGPDGKVVGYAWDAELLESQRTNAGGDFLEAIRECDKRMARAIFIPDTLFQGDTQASTFALGASHRSVWSQSVEDRLSVRARQQTAQVIDRLREWNLGANAPRARLVYSPQDEDQSDKLWTIITQLVTEGKLDPDGQAIAAEVGLPLSDVQPDPTATPPTPPPGTDPNAPPMARERVVVQLGSGSAGDVTGLPEWKLPQAYDPPAARRQPNAREARVGFAAISAGLNRAEAATIERIVALLERERDRVQRQVAGATRKATTAEVLTALGSIELRGEADVARAWVDLMAECWTIGLDRIREELAAYAEKLPTSAGAAGDALMRAYSRTASERVLAQLSTELRSELLNAYTSAVTPAGMAAVVSQTFDAYEGNEGKGPRLTTRMLSAKALNAARADAITRGGVPLQAAQFSALMDGRVCELCAELDELVVPITSLDVLRFTPPLHYSCRCVWVWITEDELDVTPTWSTPSPSKVDRYGGLVF